MAGDLALRLAKQFLGDIGSPDDWSVRVLSDAPTEAPDRASEAQMSVELRRESDDTVGFAVLTGETPGDDAQTEFVEQLHDVIMESSFDSAIPRCPGHPHPQLPEVVDGVLTWHCPKFRHTQQL